MAPIDQLSEEVPAAASVHGSEFSDSESADSISLAAGDAGAGPRRSARARTPRAKKGDAGSNIY